MKQYRLNIDGKEVRGFQGQSILEVARDNDIFIPTLCYDESMEIYGGCGICVCEVDGNPKLVKACATEITQGMSVRTDSERVRESRKTNLELLLSDHTGDCRPPCVLGCPAQTDCQGYVGLVANGEYEEAVKLVKDKIPLPASLGRVCPHPCEKECRRGLIDEPVSIQWIKRFIADQDLMNDEDRFVPECAPDTYKKVAIVGSGPMGLSAAYFLRQMGNEVTILEAMPKAGGMLRYGIPEYRLPNDVLDDEISTIAHMGVEFVFDTQIGKDRAFDTLREEYDAVLLAIGAWQSTGTGCKNEDADGVIGGIDFLQNVVRNRVVKLGEKVAVVGGGNVAMDACRTAVRMGAKEVYNIYRRTKDEMPADMLEIEEAEEEGVVFKNLRNPLEIITDENGHARQVVLQVMELGEADASGRRKPVPVEGKTETVDIDNMILAIGQKVDASLFEGLDKTRKGAVAYDPETFMTSLDGVFAGGDCGNDKISIAVESIADAKKASACIDRYLRGKPFKYNIPYYVTRDDITEKTFEDRERQCRPEMGHLDAEHRKGNFSEVIPDGYSPEAAEQEANRCLECGCHEFFDCKLIEYGNMYGAHPDRLAGDKSTVVYDDEHPFIIRDPNKCILCGLCVRACDEEMGIGAIGLVNRGFDTVIKPNMEKPLIESGCISCGRCVSVCPTGALQERQTVLKEVPLDTNVTETTCSYCSVGCSLKLESKGSMMIKSNADKDGPVNLGRTCGRGKFGFDCSVLEGKLEDPLVKEPEGFRETDYHEALIMAAKGMESIIARYGKDAAAISISDRYTNEEAFAFLHLAECMGIKTFCFNNRQSGMLPVLGIDGSPNALEEMISSDLVLVIGYNTVDAPVARLKMRIAAKQGKKVVLINPREYEQHFDTAETMYVDNDLSFLKQMAKAMIDSGITSDIEGFGEFKDSLKDVKVSDRAAEIAELYAGAKHAMILFEQNFVSVDAASLIADIALMSGHIGSPRNGIIQMKPKNNSQGLIDMGITAGAEAMKGIKGLMCFGEDPDTELLKDLEFLMVSDTHMTAAAEMADVVIPGTGFLSTDGTYTNTERRLMPVRKAINEGIEMANWEIAAEIADIYEADYGMEDIDDLADALAKRIQAYRKGELFQIFGGISTPVSPKFVAVDKDSKFVEPMKCTDNLMNMIQERLPNPASMTD